MQLLKGHAVVIKSRIQGTYRNLKKSVRVETKPFSNVQKARNASDVKLANWIKYSFPLLKQENGQTAIKNRF